MEQVVTFKLGKAETCPGESVLVVGGHDALGCWNPSSGLRMTTDEEAYPEWSATTSLSIQDGEDIEYKYVRDSMESRGEYEWEDGENRKLAFPRGAARAWEKADNGFGDSGTDALRPVDNMDKTRSKNTPAGTDEASMRGQALHLDRHFGLPQGYEFVGARFSNDNAPEFERWRQQRSASFENQKVSSLKNPHVVEKQTSPTSTELNMVQSPKQVLESPLPLVGKPSQKSDEVGREGPYAGPKIGPKVGGAFQSSMTAGKAIEHSVTFKLMNAETALGDSLIVVGSHSSLGSWDILAGLRMTSDPEAYPTWTASTSLSIREGEDIEYKYVRDCMESRGEYEWEECENRKLKFPAGKAMTWEQTDEGFGLPGNALTQITREADGRDQTSQPHKREDAFLPSVEKKMAPSILQAGPSKTLSNRAVEAAQKSQASGNRAVEAEQKSQASETRFPSDDASERDQAPLEASNIPDAVSLHNNQMGHPQRFASFSCLDQLIDDADELLGLRARKEEWKCEFQCEERPVRYGARHLNTPIVIVSSEINPWSKTGGLAMIAASYAFEFALRGHRTMAISPMYGDYDKCNCIGNAYIELAGGSHEVRYFHQRHVYGDGKSCDYIFVDHPCFKRHEGIYGPPGAEYGDNLFRFSLFTIAATEAPLILEIEGSTFGQDVLFICNDWQTGILPVYLLYKYKKHNVYVNARSMMVIHNIGYQGKYMRSRHPIDSFLHLPCGLAGPDLEGEDMHMGNDCINLLAGGIRTADRVLTVSPNYAHEIQTPEGGNGIHDVLTYRAREGRLVGILNGISDEWSPLVDPHIAKNYSVSNFQEGKRICKEALQKELGLHADPNVCLIGFCGRLCFQKGMSLIMPLIHWLLHDLEGGRSQMIIMGKGEDEWAGQVAEAEGMNRGRVCGYVGFDPCVEHRMMAGCDLLLMPSQYEPCGLPQMYAQMYGTLPVVHETGGLKDSVRGLWDEQRDQDTANGFPFCGFSQDSLKQRLCQAVWMFHHNKPMWQKMQSNAMKLDHYWPTRMDEYEEQVDLTMEGHPQRKAESWWTNHF